MSDCLTQYIKREMFRIFGLEPINKLFYHNERVQDITLLIKILIYEIKYFFFFFFLRRNEINFLFGFIKLLFLT